MNKFFLSILLIFLFSFSSFAKNSFFDGKQVSIPKVSAGDRNYSATMTLKPNSTPLKFEVIETLLIDDLGNSKTTYSDNVLYINAVNVGNKVFQATLKQIANDPLVFELESAVVLELPDTKKPTGIYVLSNRNSTSNIRDYDFVAGYTLRPHWSDLEIGDGQYDFSTIDDALTQLEAINKFLTLEVRPLSIPSHLSHKIETRWETSKGFKTGAPWDENFINRWKNFNLVLANHSLKLADGTSVRLADHPNLKQISAPIVGLSGIRERTGTLVQLPDYNRETFIQSILDSVHATIDVFPKQHHFISVFIMDDENLVQPLDEAIVEKLMEEFNYNDLPTLGFFQELLSDSGPKPELLGKLIIKYSEQTYIMFQALTSWTSSFMGHQDKVATGSPAVGIELGYNNYGASYVELYLSDIDNPLLADELRIWNNKLTSEK
jgi:hypothetical protein